MLASFCRMLVLPVLVEPPTVKSVDLPTVRIEWTAWNSDEDKGDPPLVAYAIYLTKASQVDWMEVQRVDHTVTSTAVGELQSNTEYLISVAAVREGPGGTGPKSPAAPFATECQGTGLFIIANGAYLCPAYTGIQCLFFFRNLAYSNYAKSSTNICF